MLVLSVVLVPVVTTHLRMEEALLYLLLLENELSEDLL